MRRLLSVLLIALGSTALGACRQQVVVYECVDGGHPDATTSDPDGGTAPGPDAATVDAGQLDAGAEDAAVPDAGGCDPFCFTGLEVSDSVIDIRQTAILTPTLEVADGVEWEIRVEEANLRARRLVGRPPFVASEVPLELTVVDQTVHFRVLDVPPWFMETTFEIEVEVRQVGRAVAQTQTAEVLVRGNVVISEGARGRVHAYASDGLPATGQGQFPQGILLDTLVSTPYGVTVGPDGALFVMDSGASPKRIVRFEMSGSDVLLSELQFLDDQSQPLFRSEFSAVYAFAVMDDGTVVYPEYNFAGPAGTPKSRLMIWNPDGTFQREVWAQNANEEWRSTVIDPNGDVLIADRENEVIIRYDATTWTPAGIALDNLPGSPFSLRNTGDALFVGGSGYVIRSVWGGGRAAVTGLGSTSVSWRSFAKFSDDTVLAIRSVSTDSGNVAVIRNRAFERFFRQMDTGIVIVPSGVAYLR